MSDKQIVHVIDDDAAILASTAGFLVTNGFDVRTYVSACDFLEALAPGVAGCVVTDVRMPGISGIELIGKMKERGVALPIIIVTAYADISLTVQAMKQDAVDLLEKPFNNGALVRAIREALTHWNDRTAVGLNAEIVRSRFSSLTDKEKDVLTRLLKGASNKLIADELGLGIRSLETLRATIMSKMKASSITELVRMSLNLEILEINPSPDGL